MNTAVCTAETSAEFPIGAFTVIVKPIGPNLWRASVTTNFGTDALQFGFSDTPSETAAYAVAESLVQKVRAYLDREANRAAEREAQAAITAQHQARRLASLKLTDAALDALEHAINADGIVRISPTFQARRVQEMVEAGLMTPIHEPRRFELGVGLTGGQLTDAGRRWSAERVARRADRAKTTVARVAELLAA